MDDLVSIIVPVYNVEFYLERCIRSLELQTYTNIEIILVDDCSTDKSLEKCKYFQKIGTKTIQVIHHDINLGVCEARNSGLKKARGKWIMFLDSDDSFTPNAVEEMLKFAKKYNCDIVFAPYNSIRNDVIEKRNTPKNSFFCKSEEFSKYCLTQIPYDVMSCIGSKIYKKELIDKYAITFEEKYKYNEDGAFMSKFLLNAKIIGYCNITFYNYFRREKGSSQSSYRPHMYKTIASARLLLKQFFINTHSFYGEQKSFFINLLVSLTIEALFNEALYGTYSSFKQECKIIHKFNMENGITNSKHNCNIKQKIIFFCLKNKMYLLYYYINKIMIYIKN